MRWPWQRRVERRQSGYTSAITDAFEMGALGGDAGANQTAALEAAASAYARAFAAAELQDAPVDVAAALAPSVLADMARDMIRRGESVHRITMARGRLRLQRAGSWDMRGGADPDDWECRLSIYGPSSTETAVVPYASIVHCRYASDPARPWHGLPPSAWASLSSALHAGAVGALRADMRASSGYVVATPPGEQQDDPEDDPLDPMKAAVKGLKGRTMFAETMRGAHGGDHRDAPLRDWKQERLGADPPETLASLHDTTAAAVLAAAGVDPVIVGLARGDGTLAREAFRRFERLSVGPLARIVEAEIRDKLDAPGLRLDFTSLRASDTAGLARAYKALTEAGLTPDQAGAILDLDL